MGQKSAFTATDYSAVDQHVKENPNLIWLNPPAEYAGMQPLPPAATAFQQLIQSNDPRRFAQAYAYNVSPADDNAPFFFFTLKTAYVLRTIPDCTAHATDS